MLLYLGYMFLASFSPFDGSIWSLRRAWTTTIGYSRFWQRRIGNDQRESHVDTATEATIGTLEWLTQALHHPNRAQIVLNLGNCITAPATAGRRADPETEVGLGAATLSPF